MSHLSSKSTPLFAWRPSPSDEPVDHWFLLCLNRPHTEESLRFDCRTCKERIFFFACKSLFQELHPHSRDPRHVRMNLGFSLNHRKSSQFRVTFHPTQMNRTPRWAENISNKYHPLVILTELFARIVYFCTLCIFSLYRIHKASVYFFLPGHVWPPSVFFWANFPHWKICVLKATEPGSIGLFRTSTVGQRE